MMATSNRNIRKICIAGYSGFIGNAAAKFFSKNNFIVHPIYRSDLEKGARHIASMIEGTEMVINVAGAPIQKRWTSNYKEEIYNSRIITTRIIVDAIRFCKEKPKAFISSSAVGIYNSTDIHDEFSDKLSNSFLGSLCRNWETEALRLSKENSTRLVIFRFGIVLGKNGGAFPKMLQLFKFFMGSRIGDGYQWFPLIHIDDVLSAFWFIHANNSARGIYNLVVPNIVSYNRFCANLGKALKRPYWLAVPNFILKLIYGDGSNVLLRGQHVKPHRLIREGFYFQYPNTGKVIKALLDKKSIN